MQFAGLYEGLKIWRASAVIEGHLIGKSANGLFYCTFAVSLKRFFLDTGFVKPSDEQIYFGIF